MAGCAELAPRVPEWSCRTMATTALKRRLHTPTSAALLPLLPNHRLPVLAPHGRPQLGEGQLGQLHQLQGQVQQSQAHRPGHAEGRGGAVTTPGLALVLGTGGGWGAAHERGMLGGGDDRRRRNCLLKERVWRRRRQRRECPPPPLWTM